MSDADGRLASVHADISRRLQAEVTAVVDAEFDAARVTELLGAVKALDQVARSLAGLERRALQTEARKDLLRATLNDADRSEANRIKERIDRLQGRIDRLGEQRDGLEANLAALAESLGS